jgi:D-methionine transport system substrate-binding protein
VEPGDSIYCCLVVVRAADADAGWAKTLAAGYADAGVKSWVIETFKGAVVPGA